jgi:hypothetical protein
MADQKNSKSNSSTKKQQISPEKYARLKAEAKAPYRILRKFIYFACGASGLIGALIFLAQLAAGNEVATALPNLGVQLGVIGLMVFLFRLENQAERKQ